MIFFATFSNDKPDFRTDWTPESIACLGLPKLLYQRAALIFLKKRWISVVVKKRDQQKKRAKQARKVQGSFLPLS